MEVIIKGDPKEITDLVYAIRGQRNHEYTPLAIIQEAVRQAIDDIAEA